ncbi:MULTISPECIES: hypothetical protein [Sorangium]|uniref:hypothetical protein n=1 Tax=Sorangium TaxID=39643 RepID=UPI003D9C3FCE
MPCLSWGGVRWGEALVKGPVASASSGRVRAAALRGWGSDGPQLDAAIVGSLPRARAALGLAGLGPWHCSPRVLRLIVALALSSGEIGVLVSAAVGREDGAVAEEPSGEALRVLIDAVLTNARAARRLARALDAALVDEASGYRGLCVSELAGRWALARATAPARAAAALLWASARTPGSPMRSLEERIADDIELRALRAMATSMRAAGAPCWTGPTRPTRRSNERRGERGPGAVALAGRGR